MSGLAHLDQASTALLLVDLQNDFIHPDGAYARGGVTSATIEALPNRLGAVIDAARSRSIPTIATLFTLVPGPDGPLISEPLARLRPFLTDGDFAPGSWGQSSIDAVGPIDITVEKVAYSAFHASRLEFVLDRLAVTTLLVAGIVTNGGVASTVRAAHVLDLHTVVLSDGCAAFGAEPHDAAIASLATVSEVATCSDVLGWLQGLS
ncbi:MAG: cysteine hydrolase [Acidimicrobiaceae bacterium]|mgnify:FL=1|nr:cysteine hydrolase [Acidimicrobiaceae bacterium]MBT5579968.1 cysteine hydrolase [Acidimicrobiaceae bacterium]MBT5850540.1 cysteine hydrolase [Acidimicrobiaceae bacterium]